MPQSVEARYASCAVSQVSKIINVTQAITVLIEVRLFHPVFTIFQHNLLSPNLTQVLPSRRGNNRALSIAVIHEQPFPLYHIVQLATFQLLLQISQG